jgi:ceramide glucosyltransferase
VFTHPLPLALLLWGVAPDWWPLVLAAAALRLGAAYAVAWKVLRDPLTSRLWWLLPLEDIASFAFWVAGFFGRTIHWRGRRYLLHRDGTFTLQ